MCFGDLKRIIFNIIAYSPSKIYIVFRRFEDNDDVWTYCLLTVSIIIESLVQYNIRNYFCLHKFWKFSWLVFTSWIYEVSYSYFIDVENFSIFWWIIAHSYREYASDFRMKVEISAYDLSVSEIWICRDHWLSFKLQLPLVSGCTLDLVYLNWTSLVF